MEDEALKNQVVNRGVIDIFGYQLPMWIFARNGSERLEKILDGAFFLGLGLAIPILLQRTLAKVYQNVLVKQFALPKGVTPLQTNFEQLDVAKLLPHSDHVDQLAKAWGVKAGKVPKLAQWVRNAKLLIIGVDLLFLMSQNMAYYWTRNKMTEKLSKKEGFSGEFNSVTDLQLQENSAYYQRSKARLKKFSSAAWLTGFAGLPLLMLAALTTKQTTGVMGGLKKMLPFFNYHKTIYMSKWVMFWSTFFGYNLMGLLSARSPNEKREHLTKAVMLDVLFYLGDSVFSGLNGWWLQHRSKHKEAVKGVALYQRGWLGIPIERSLEAIREDAAYQRLATHNPELRATVEQLARRNFRVGLVTTSLLLGVGTTVLNNVYTHAKLITQQNQLAQRWLPLFQRSPSLRHPKINTAQQAAHPVAGQAVFLN